DCVNVCPKDALYFGFGKPSVAAPAPKRARRRVYDLTWPEETAPAAVFLPAISAFRGLYQRIPFLLAIGLSVIAAIAAVAGARLVRRRDFSLPHGVLRRGGRGGGRGASVRGRR